MAGERLSRLQEMMQADEENVPNCRKLLRDFHPDLEFLLDYIVDHYTILSDEIEKIVHGGELTQIQQLATEAGIPIEEFTKRVDSADNHPLVVRAREAKHIYL